MTLTKRREDNASMPRWCFPSSGMFCLGATSSPYGFSPPVTTLTSPERLYVPAVTTYWWRKCPPAFVQREWRASAKVCKYICLIF